MSTGNCFYSNIIEYGTDWGAHNNHPQNSKFSVYCCSFIYVHMISSTPKKTLFIFNNLNS